MSPYDYFDSDEVFDNSKFVSFEQLTNDIKGGHPVAKQGIEGTGSAAEVFGIVVHAIIQYVKKARPALLYFQAAEPNRRALYARMIQRVLPSLPGWASMTVGNGEFGIYNKRAVKSAMTEGDLDRFKKYIRPVVKTTPKIEKTTNPSGRTTDHVEWKVTGNTGEVRRFKSKKEAQAYFDSCNQGVDEEVTRQMSQGGLRASYQAKYNQPMSEDYLDEARS
jgi:hypothetical protein